MIRPMLALLVGLGMGGCVFSPDMGDGESCQGDADCTQFGQCACVGGKCVPAAPNATCTAAPSCADPEILCGSTCIDPRDDSNHCDICDKACDDPPDSVCKEDQWGAHFQVDFDPVGTCVERFCEYTPSDTPCPQGCENGACLPGCPGGCGDGEECVQGVCSCGGTGPDCDDDQQCCGNQCSSPLNDHYNCGSCDNDCTVLFSVCQSESERYVRAPGLCVDGECNGAEDLIECPNGCEAGECIDDPCGGPCVTPPPPWCEEGSQTTHVAVGECLSGWCEYPIDFVTNCVSGCDAAAGMCNGDWCAIDADCGPGQVCRNGTCVCDGAMANCNQSPDDGCEVDTRIHPAHCGSCWTDCGAQRCIEGDCVPFGADTAVACGQEQDCDADSFCCFIDDEPACLQQNMQQDCNGGWVLLCDDPSDCPNGDLCCFDPGAQRSACTSMGYCVTGHPACIDVGDCDLNSFCDIFELNGEFSIGICMPT